MRNNLEVTLRLVTCPMTASLHAWNIDFKGDAAKALLNTIRDLLSPMATPYARVTCIINSSGTGKSRMVDEISTRIITVPMCLRPHGSQGFIPASWVFTVIIWFIGFPLLTSVALRQYFEQIGITRDQERIKRALHGIVHGLITVTHAQLRSFACDITLPIDLPDREYIEQVILRQQKLAVTFREFMTRDQSFRTSE